MTSPQTEPISLAEVMAHCRILSADATEQAKLSMFISAAREYAEGYTGKCYGSRTVTTYRASLDDIMELSEGPVISITSISAVRSDGESEDVTSYYQIDTMSDDPRLVGRNLPQIDLSADVLYPVTVTYTAGGDMPPMVKQACLLIIGHWYENREEVVVSAGNAVQIPLAAKALLEMLRHQAL